MENNLQLEIEKSIKDVIERQVRAHIDMEIQKAQQRVAAIFKQRAAAIVLQVLKQYDVQMAHDRVVITVNQKDLFDDS